jgi:hypothetical protein
MQQPDFLYIYILHMSEYSEIFDTLYTYEKCKLHFESHISQSGGITSEHKLTDLLVFWGVGQGRHLEKTGSAFKAPVIET